MYKLYPISKENNHFLHIPTDGSGSGKHKFPAPLRADIFPNTTYEDLQLIFLINNIIIFNLETKQ